MIIHNRETNNLKLVEKVDLRGPLHLFMQGFSASTGFSLEVFRNERHLASITPNNSSRFDLQTLMLANHALQINLGPRLLLISAQLSTLDNFTRAYTLELSIRVSQPTLFATLYIQHSDPVAIAQRSIANIFTRWAQNHQHNEITVPILTQLAQSAFSAATQQSCGITVHEVMRVEVQLDAHYGQVTGFEQEEMVERARIQRDGRLNNTELDVQQPLQDRRDENELQRDRRLSAHAIQQKVLQQQAEIFMEDLRKKHERSQVIQDVYVKSLSEKISEHLGNGYNLQELWNQYPELRSLLESSVQGQIGSPGSTQGFLPQPGGNNPNLPFDSFSQRALPPVSGTQSEPPVFRTKARRTGSQNGNNDIIEMEARQTPGFDATYEPVIKVKEIRPAPIQERPTPFASPAPSSTAQTQPGSSNPNTFSEQGFPSSTLAMPTSPIPGTSFRNDRLGATLSIISMEDRNALQLDEQIVFCVEALDIGGTAQRASVVRNDYLVEINHQVISNIQTLLSCLENSTTLGTMSLRVLRLGQLYDLPEIKLTQS